MSGRTLAEWMARREQAIQAWEWGRRWMRPHSARPAPVRRRMLGEQARLANTPVSDLPPTSASLYGHSVSTEPRGLADRATSLGSVIGTFQSVSVHRQNQAELRTDRTGKRVIVKFGTDQIDAVRDMLGKRVMVKGMLERDPAGQLLSVDFKHAEVLPSLDGSPRLSTYTGFYPDLTGGLTITEHLEAVRGAS